jgi:hypothetical protein
MRAAAFLASVLVAHAALAQSDADRREWPRTDFSKRTVELAEIQSGGPPKDGIPAIDRPRFVDTRAAFAWLKPNEPVIVLRLGGDARAYPIQILMFHEIANDIVGDVPVAVTFCPLCNASIVFDRRVAGRVLDFGTTGRLRFSDLVMYDRQTESWWQQFTGKGIIGHFAGLELKQLPSEIVAFADFTAAHPGGLVLSRETGYSRPYGRNPYAGYDRIDQTPFLFMGKRDDRLPPIDSERIERGREIPAATAFDRRQDGRKLEFEARSGRYFDKQTGAEWNVLGEAVAGPLKGKRLHPVTSGVHFAFAWLAFNPQSEIVRQLP